MLFLLIGVILIVVTLIEIHQAWDDDTETVLVVLTIMYWFFGIGMIGGMSYGDSCTDVSEFLEFKDKIENYQEIYPFREHLSEEEILKAFEYNRWIIKKQISDKSFVIGFFISNRVRDLKPIKTSKLFW
jgi:hypothetical protein